MLSWLPNLSVTNIKIVSDRCPAGDLYGAWLNNKEISVDGNQEGGEGGEKDKSGLVMEMDNRKLMVDNWKLIIDPRYKYKSVLLMEIN